MCSEKNPELKPNRKINNYIQEKNNKNARKGKLRRGEGKPVL